MNNEQPTPSIDRVQVLHGHTSPENAYVVSDYPYGSLRCTIRFWLETATKGAPKGQTRFVSQTLNPKRPGEHWNKPRRRTYHQIVAMYLDSINHVQWWGIGYSLTPGTDARARLMGIYDQLTERDRRRYDLLLAHSQQQTTQWEQWEETLSAITRHIEETGQDPVVVNGMWEVDGRSPHYLGVDAAAYVATARLRLQS